MASHPTYVVIRYEVGGHLRTEVLYVGPSQEHARELAEEESGYGAVRPGKEFLQYRYHCTVQAWSGGEKVSETVYDRNGNVREKDVR